MILRKENRRWLYAFIILSLWSALATGYILISHINKNKALALQAQILSQKINPQELTDFTKYFTKLLLEYDQSNYWRNQMSLTALMDQALKRKTQTDLEEKFQRRNEIQYDQRIEIYSIEHSAQSLRVSGQLYGKEKAGKSLSLSWSAQLGYKKQDRNFENPWPYIVTELSLQTDTKAFPVRPLILKLQTQQELTLWMPCAPKKISSTPENELTIKTLSQIQGESQSEVQIKANSEITNPIQLNVFCDLKQFEVTLINGSLNEFDLARKIVTAQALPSKRTVEQKAIEKELGFIIEQEKR
jgi:hypothetical protein